MKGKTKIIIFATAAVILLLAVTAAVAFLPDDKNSGVSETVEETVSRESESIYIPPFSDSKREDTGEDRVDVELDIGSIERDTDPTLLDTKIEYGTKEGKEDEEKDE